MIAMALALDPRILIADEPTTALDVTVQAQVMDLLKDLQRDTGMGLILITHDLGVVAEVADRVAVMYAGKIVETGTVDDVFTQPGAPVHARPDGVHPAGGGQGWPAEPDRGPAAEPRGHPQRVCLPPAVPEGADRRRRRARTRLRRRRAAAASIVPGREAACHYSEEVLGV